MLAAAGALECIGQIAAVTGADLICENAFARIDRGQGLPDFQVCFTQFKLCCSHLQTCKYCGILSASVYTHSQDCVSETGATPQTSGHALTCPLNLPMSALTTCPNLQELLLLQQADLEGRVSAQMLCLSMHCRPVRSQYATANGCISLWQ